MINLVVAPLNEACRLKTLYGKLYKVQDLGVQGLRTKVHVRISDQTCASKSHNIVSRLSSRNLRSEHGQQKQKTAGSPADNFRDLGSNRVALASARKEVLRHRTEERRN